MVFMIHSSTSRFSPRSAHSLFFASSTSKNMFARERPYCPWPTTGRLYSIWDSEYGLAS